MTASSPHVAPTDPVATQRTVVRDLLTLARIALLWPAAAVLKRALPLPRLVGLFDAQDRGSTLSPDRAAHLIDKLLHRAYRGGPGYCVERSLLLFHLLRRAGLPARLCFGLGRGPSGAFQGHAWVTLDGNAVAERPDVYLRFKVTYAYPSGVANVRSARARI